MCPGFERISIAFEIVPFMPLYLDMEDPGLMMAMVIVRLEVLIAI